MKYVIATTADGTKIPVIFPEFMEFADFAVAVSEMLKDFSPEITSMGHLTIDQVIISEGAAADGLEIVCHDHFNCKSIDLSIN